MKNEVKMSETSSEAAAHERKLQVLDKPTASHRLKVVFTSKSSQNGNVATLDRCVAEAYERQGKVKIIK